jgi:hypothetical protein
MDASRLTFTIFGRRCVVALPPTLDGIAPANDAALEGPTPVGQGPRSEARLRIVPANQVAGSHSFAHPERDPPTQMS